MALAEDMSGYGRDEEPEAREMRVRTAMQGVVGDLEAEATKRVSQRMHIEKRWIEDLEHFHGIHDKDVRARLKETGRSALFTNKTRVKTNALAARLEDMLFPSDDRNWDITPTPVPEMVQAAEVTAQEAQQAAEQADTAEQQGDPNAPAMRAQANALEQQAEQLRRRQDEARRRSEAMRLEIQDQLDESRWPAQCRDVIADGIKLGCGVLKGPVTADRVRRRWEDAGDGLYRLAFGGMDSPGFIRVDPWSFFPDMTVPTLEEGQGVYERHLYNAKQLRRLSRLPGFDKDAIRRLIARRGTYSVPGYLADLRNLGENTVNIDGDYWCVWEYSGPLEADALQALYEAAGDEAGLDELAEVDPLDEVNAVIWFCDGEVLKVAPYPLDSGDCLYSLFTLEKDEATPFGAGLPRIMRDEQIGLNSARRSMQDNASIGAGPQVVVRKGAIEPSDGDWTPRPFKTWYLRDGAIPDGVSPFQQFKFDMSLQELMALVGLSERMIDDTTAMPAIAQGEQGNGVTRTAQGMALLMSSTNVVFRRIVKSFDDDVIVPTLRRAYDWNMQFNPKAHIKGDFEVIARGSSVLLVREMQSQNLVAMGDRYAGHPIFGPMLRKSGLPLLRAIFQSNMLPVDEIILSETEFAAEMRKMASASEAAAQIEMAKLELAQADLQARIEIANMDADTRRFVAEMQQQTVMMQTAEKINMHAEDLSARTEAAKADRGARERSLAAEIGMQARTGVSSGGAV